MTVSRFHGSGGRRAGRWCNGASIRRTRVCNVYKCAPANERLLKSPPKGVVFREVVLLKMGGGGVRSVRGTGQQGVDGMPLCQKRMRTEESEEHAKILLALVASRGVTNIYTRYVYFVKPSINNHIVGLVHKNHIINEI